MTTYTAGDQINRALRLLGVLAEGETSSASVMQDSLTALNQMIDSWSTERLSVYNTQDQVYLWPAGEIYRTLGPGTATFTGTISGTTLTVTAVASGPIEHNMTIVGAGVTPGTHILSQLTGENWNVGTYLLSLPSVVASPTTITGSADFVGNRPILLDDSTYFRDPGTNVSFGIKMINQQQYNGIAVKTVTSTYPQVMWVNMEYPFITMTIYPRPTRVLEWHFVSVEELAQPATLSTNLLFPPGYLRAFTYGLAMEIAPEFGVEPSPQVQRIAMTSKRNLKRINNPDDVMSMPYSLVATRQRFNVYAGNY